MAQYVAVVKELDLGMGHNSLSFSCIQMSAYSINYNCTLTLLMVDVKVFLSFVTRLQLPCYTFSHDAM